ncbi:uncharacterized protein [Pagrus major]|uniref:uncharacterized protein n=1 Tax=Pagrus major TaxID=143350 RepID=UPI003CC8DD45
MCPPPTLSVPPTAAATISATGIMCPPPTLSVPPTVAATITATGIMWPPPTLSVPPTAAATITATGIMWPPPTLSVPPTSGALISATGITCAPESSPPTTREAACQCGDVKKDTREIECQTDRFVGKRPVATQLSKGTLVNRNSTGSQATVSTKSVAVGDTTFQFLPLQSSTPLKQKAVPENPPTKRPHLEFPSIQESEPSVSFVDPDDSSYLPMSESVDTTSEQAPTKPVQDMVKYLVYEECLLELFKICPTCSTVCKVDICIRTIPFCDPEVPLPELLLQQTVEESTSGQLSCRESAPVSRCILHRLSFHPD